MRPARRREIEKAAVRAAADAMSSRASSNELRGNVQADEVVVLDQAHRLTMRFPAGSRLLKIMP